MKNRILKPVSFILCAALIAGGVGTTVYATGAANKTVRAGSETVMQAAGENTANEAIVNEAIANEPVKDETVYVLLKADGSVEKIIVSDWIKNLSGSDKLTDKSELMNVENVKGDETYTLDSSNMRVWDADGKDIYYQGNIEKGLPVDISVSYRLDGKDISAEELAGKSGRVTIRFDYKNNQYEMADINGTAEKIYVPFVMLTGMLLDNDVFCNTEVSNGKLINDGNHTAVIGIAFPGLGSNLNINTDKLEIPDYVEITADVKNFKMANTVTVATNEPFCGLSDLDTELTDKLTGSLEELTNAAAALMDGSSKLYDGLCTLLEKSGELIAGIDKLAEGAASLKSGAGELYSGTEALCGGTGELAGGLAALTANNDTLNAGAKQVFDSLLNMAGEKLASAGLTVPVLTVENYTAVLTGLIDNFNMVLSSGAATAEDAAKAQYALAAVTALKEQLDSYNMFCTGLNQYTAGVAAAKAGADSLNAGAAKLNEGSAKLYAGIDSLYSGILTLKNGAPVLYSGVTELRDGAMKLSDGFKEFYEKGIEKLAEAVNGDVTGLLARVSATAAAADNYNSFSGISEDMDGQVKFIYRTDSVEEK